MSWKIKAIEDNKGNDIFLGDILNVKDSTDNVQQITVHTIAIPNGMLFINGTFVDMTGEMEMGQEN
jgi:hypothetical protein